MSVCLSAGLFVIPLAYLKNYTSKFPQIFGTCYLWSWLDPPILWQCNELRISVFVNDVMFPHNRANGPESKTTRMFRPVRQMEAPETKSAVSDCILYTY